MPKRLQNWVNGNFYQQTPEKFLVLPTTDADIENLRIERYQEKSRQDKLAISHDQVARLQNAKFALVPVHTREEINCFKDLVKPLLPLPSNRIQVWKDLVVIWNHKADGKTIFYKSVEYLDSYYRKWSKHLVEEKTALQYADRLKHLSKKLRERTETQIPAALEREAVITRVTPTELPDVLSFDVVQEIPMIIEDAISDDTFDDSNNSNNNIEENTATRATVNLDLTTVSSSYNAISEVTEPVQILQKKKRKRKLCKLCGGLCPGSGNRELCIGSGPSSLLGQDGTPRNRRHCSSCKSSDCPGTNKRNRCPSYLESTQN